MESGKSITAVSSIYDLLEKVYNVHNISITEISDRLDVQSIGTVKYSFKDDND